MTGEHAHTRMTRKTHGVGNPPSFSTAAALPQFGSRWSMPQWTRLSVLPHTLRVLAPSHAVPNADVQEWNQLQPLPMLLCSYPGRAPSTLPAYGLAGAPATAADAATAEVHSCDGVQLSGCGSCWWCCTALGTYGLMQLRSDVGGWPLVVDQGTVAGSRQVLLGGMPGQLGAGAVGAPGAAIYALGSAPDLTVSDSSNSSSTALMFVPGQGGVPATMLSVPAQQQQQGLLRPSEYLLLKQQQWQQQQQLQHVSSAQLEALQLQLQQQQLGDHQASVQAVISSLPAASITAPYMNAPIPEAAVTSAGVYVQQQQYPQSYMIHAAGGDVLSAVSSGLCMLPPGV